MVRSVIQKAPMPQPRQGRTMMLSRANCQISLRPVKVASVRSAPIASWIAGTRIEPIEISENPRIGPSSSRPRRPPPVKTRTGR